MEGHTAAAAAPTLGLTMPNVVDPPQVAFAVKDVDLTEWEGDILAVLVTENNLSTATSSSRFTNAAALAKLDGELGGLLSEASAEEDFTGRAGQSVALRLPTAPGRHGFKRVCLIGVGNNTPSSAAAYRSLGETVAAAAKSAQARTAAVALAFPPPDWIHQEDHRLNAAAAVASGLVLGLHEDSRYKSESKKLHLKQVDFIGSDYGDELDTKLKYANHVSSAVIFAKELVNSPANVLTPAALAEEASKIASTYSDVLTATILDEEKCRELKMGSYLAVAAASANPPHGGYNIKIGAVTTIELMKKDMGGSAAVFGAAKALGQIKPPGVEIIDLATLTGYCRIALGPSIAGILTPSDELDKEVAAAYEASGEKFWRLPLEETYWEQMKSSVADMLNTGSPLGGAITAGLFLKQFVDEKVQWMHIDMAGPVWNYKKQQATGFGVSTLVEWVLINSS
uniref:Cytosol aminopeptidase domain-containing protein n=1 Tax=Oryza punctata TaxID=4537 RepID=A0A0E0MLZ2_ORYPU